MKKIQLLSSPTTHVHMPEQQLAEKSTLLVGTLIQLIFFRMRLSGFILLLALSVVPLIGLGQSPYSSAAASLTNKNHVGVMDSQSPYSKEISDRIDTLIMTFFLNDYQSALNQSREIQKILPEHPIGYLYEAVVSASMIFDFAAYDYLENYLELIDTAIDKSKKLARTERAEEPWGTFYYAGSLGFRGIYHVLYGNYIRAARDGVRAYEKMADVVAVNPSFYDAYYGIGLYNFWYGIYLNRFMSTYEQERYIQKGISSMHLAHKHGTVTKGAAASALLFFYDEINDAASAKDVIAMMQKDYDNFIGFNWVLANFFFYRKDYEQSLVFLKRAEANLATSPLTTEVSYINLYTQLGRLYAQMENKDAAMEMFSKLFNSVAIEKAMRKDNVPSYVKSHYKKSKEAYANLK